MSQKILKNRSRAIPKYLKRSRPAHTDRLVFAFHQKFSGAKRDATLVNEPHRADGGAVSLEGKLETLGGDSDRFGHLAGFDELGCSWNLRFR